MTSPTRQDLMRLLRRSGFEVKSLALGTGSNAKGGPRLVVDRGSYPGVEAHLCTIADGALWRSELDAEHDVVIHSAGSEEGRSLRPSVPVEAGSSWNRLMASIENLCPHLEPYRVGVRRGIFSTVMWAHHDEEWFRLNREAPLHTIRPPDEYIEHVDVTIRPHIRELNRLGFATLECCSSLPQDHPDRDPWYPYIMFDERIYPRATPHLFTLADMAGWIPSYARYNFDVAMRVPKGEPVEAAWDRLVSKARVLEAVIREYRGRVGFHVTPSGKSQS